MTAVDPSHRQERTTAVAIFATAAVVAAWIAFHHPPKIPVRIVEQRTAEPEKPVPQPTPSQDAAADPAMKFEIVELPAPSAAMPSPAPPAVSPPAKAAPPPSPPPVQTARAEPAPQPPPAKAVTPETPPPAPLRPEAIPRATVVPLQAEVPAPRAVAPAKPLQVLRPGDEKASAIPIPVQPLHVETERPVSRETRPPQTLTPAPQISKPEPPKAETRTPKIDAWVPKLKQRAPVPASEPEARQEVTPAPAPMIHVEAAPASPAAAAKPVSEKEVATEGRVLLRMFEQGAGPSIEIRWPSQAGERDRLYDVFTQCLGMKVGLLDDQGHVYLGEGPRTQPMALNMDKYSGFVRRPEGAIASDEQQEIARIRAYHGVSAPSARMFPRRVDAYLLGGLRAAVGDQYLKMKSVRAAYRLSGRRVIIDSITADGRRLDGVIDLSTVASCS